MAIREGREVVGYRVSLKGGGFCRAVDRDASNGAAFKEPTKERPAVTFATKAEARKWIDYRVRNGFGDRVGNYGIIPVTRAKRDADGRRLIGWRVGYRPRPGDRIVSYAVDRDANLFNAIWRPDKDRVALLFATKAEAQEWSVARCGDPRRCPERYIVLAVYRRKKPAPAPVVPTYTPEPGDPKAGDVVEWDSSPGYKRVRTVASVGIRSAMGADQPCLTYGDGYDICNGERGVYPGGGHDTLAHFRQYAKEGHARIVPPSPLPKVGDEVWVRGKIAALISNKACIWIRSHSDTTDNDDKDSIYRNLSQWGRDVRAAGEARDG